MFSDFLMKSKKSKTTKTKKTAKTKKKSKKSSMKKSGKILDSADDSADAISQIVQKRVVGETINLGGKDNVKIIDLAEKIAQIVGKDITFEVKK